MTARPAREQLSALIEPLRPYLTDIVAAMEEVPESRRQRLAEIADYTVDRYRSGMSPKLTFICTHNSRRSQFGQVWCQTAAAMYRLPALHAYSGGTEVTACDQRTVAAFRRTGLAVVRSTRPPNPVHLVQFADESPPIRCYSKIYDSGENPSKDFAAVICCGDADRHCPTVSGAGARFALHYEDPKSADGSPDEAAAYDARCRQIAQEMFWLAAAVAHRCGLDRER